MKAYCISPSYIMSRKIKAIKKRLKVMKNSLPNAVTYQCTLFHYEIFKTLNLDGGCIDLVCICGV